MVGSNLAGSCGWRNCSGWRRLDGSWSDTTKTSVSHCVIAVSLALGFSALFRSFSPQASSCFAGDFYAVVQVAKACSLTMFMAHMTGCAWHWIANDPSLTDEVRDLITDTRHMLVTCLTHSYSLVMM